jgi:SAM-dependent methyltransferase
VADDEVRRVRVTYAQRPSSAVRYDNRRIENVNALASRERAWGRGLLAAEHDLGRVLEVGAGDGNVLRWAVELGATLAVGVDVQADRLAAMGPKGGRTLPVLADGRALPLRAAAFDTAICSTLFSSVLAPDVAEAVARQVDAALRPGGAVLWYDLRRSNPHNRDVRGVDAGDIQRWFPGYSCSLERVTLLPPLARRVARSPAVSLALEALPPLRSHLAGVLVKP